MSKQAELASSGISFRALLFILFLGLKLGNVIDWPWVWVFAPLWVPLLVAAVLIVVLLIIVAIAK